MFGVCSGSKKADSNKTDTPVEKGAASSEQLKPSQRRLNWLNVDLYKPEDKHVRVKWGFEKKNRIKDSSSTNPT